jgi:hypothetical protein
MQNNSLDFTIEMAGCLICLTPFSMGGISLSELEQIWEGNSDRKIKDLVNNSLMMPMSLYQDDGYNIRFIVGNLNDKENAEWIARAQGKLSIPCGKIIVSGVFPEYGAFPTYSDNREIEEIMRASDGGSYTTGCYIDVAPDNYEVEVYSYHPHNLSYPSYKHLDSLPNNPRVRVPYIKNEFEEIFSNFDFQNTSVEPNEKDEDFFRRTHPNEAHPDWLTGEGDTSNYINFIITLNPINKALPPPKLQLNGFIAWEFRKPTICPTGIRCNKLTG